MSDQQLPPPSWPEPEGPGADGDPWSVPGTAESSGESVGWAPPPTPRRSNRRRWTIVAVVLFVIVAVGGALGLVVEGRGEDNPVVAGSESGPNGLEPGASTDSPDSPARRSTGPRSTESGDLTSAEAEAHRNLFDVIDAAERAMISLNEVTPPSVEDLSDGAVGDFRDAAGTHAEQLRGLHDDLLALDDAGSDAVAAIREDYALHLEAWIDWADAVAGDPTLVDRADAAAPYSEAINFTAEGFTAAVATNLDRSRAPEDIVELADRIITRGFSSDDGGTEI